MTKKKCVALLDILRGIYPNAKPALEFSSPFELLVAVILSAQCTDARVNLVTRELFKKYRTAADFAALSEEELEPLIHSCGFYKNKAKGIIGSARIIERDFGGNVPSEIEVLETLPSVGRKTANVVASVAFGADAIAVDTHVFRVSNRTGLANAQTPLEVEKQLQKIIPKDRWSESHHLLIYHGRNICHARKPLCETCPIKEICEHKLARKS